MRTKWLSGLILIVLAVGIYYGSEWLSYRQFVANSQIYEDSENKFSFRYPEDWNLLSERDLKLRNKKFVAGVSRIRSADVAVGVIIQQNSGKTFERERFVQALEENLSNLDHYERLNLKDVEVSGHKAVDITYSYKPENRAPVKQRQLIIITPDKLYYLSGGMAKTDPGQYWQQIKHVFQSFQIMK